MVSYTTINQSGRSIQIMLLVMASFLSLSLVISALLNWYNRRIAIVER
jgi:general L-amino acid transport system permease protein